MIFLAVDDELHALEDLKEALHQAVPGCQVLASATVEQALNYVRTTVIEVAFLDIELGRTNGIELAKQIKDICPQIRVIFVTGYQQYAIDAFRIHATGYLLKPVAAGDITAELIFVYGEIQDSPKKAVRVQTFGGFGVYVNEKPIHFTRSKAKELLAYLVNRRGADVTTPAACSVLWEEEPYDRQRKNYFHIVLLDLRRTLQSAGIEHILVRGRNRLAIDVSQIECDSYLFIEGVPRAINSYRHDYLSDYSWAEFTVGILEAEALKNTARHK